MDEFTLIKKLESLKSTEPRKSWVFSAKAQILEKQFESEAKPSFASSAMAMFQSALQPRFAAAFSAIALFVFGSFTFVAARGAMPGDPLYGVKQFEEKVKIALITSPEQKTMAQVEQATNRLDELDKVAKQSENQEKKAVAVNEVKKALSEVGRQLAKMSDGQKADLLSKLAPKIKDVEKSANAVIMDENEQDYKEIYKFLADSEIKAIEANEKNLTPKQAELLNNARELFVVEKYDEALDAVYQIQPSNPEIKDNPDADAGANDNANTESPAEPQNNEPQPEDSNQ
ncbi:MAG: DUF5667 domain-containing protein [Candidatus Pacebacteria bacterium]|nr:DUF5667 domain-containing protein [Candidatus Paceibacterota bacterium]